MPLSTKAQQTRENEYRRLETQLRQERKERLKANLAFRDIHYALKEHRFRHKLTQAQLAKRLGVGLRTLHGWEQHEPCALPGPVLLALEYDNFRLTQAQQPRSLVT